MLCKRQSRRNEATTITADTKRKPTGKEAEQLTPDEQKRRFEELRERLETDGGETLARCSGRSCRRMWEDRTRPGDPRGAGGEPRRTLGQMTRRSFDVRDDLEAGRNVGSRGHVEGQEPKRFRHGRVGAGEKNAFVSDRPAGMVTGVGDD